MTEIIFQCPEEGDEHSFICALCEKKQNDYAYTTNDSPDNDFCYDCVCRLVDLHLATT